MCNIFHIKFCCIMIEGGMCHFWDSISGETRVKDSDFITTGAKDDFGKLNSRISKNLNLIICNVKFVIYLFIPTKIHHNY